MDKIRTKAEYKEELNSLLDKWTTAKDSRPQNLKKLADALYEETAKDIIKENEEKYTRLAQNFEKRRPLRSRIPDERRTAKDTRPITRRTYRTWRRNPARMDLRAIDTKRGTTTTRRIVRGRIETRRYKTINKRQLDNIIKRRRK